MNKKIEIDRISRQKRKENRQKSFEMLTIKEKLQYIDKTNISEGIYFKKYTDKQRNEALLKAELILERGNKRRKDFESRKQKKFLSF